MFLRGWHPALVLSFFSAKKAKSADKLAKKNKLKRERKKTQRKKAAAKPAAA